MAVDEERGSGREAGGHESGLVGVEPDQDEALPGSPVALGVGTKLVKEGLLELQDFLHVHADDEGLGSGGGEIGEDDVFEFVVAGGNDGCALVNLSRIEQVENGKVLNLKDFVHALDAEAAFAVEEIGDMGLLESGLLGEAESGEFSCFDTVPKDLAEVILQEFELHGRSIALGYSACSAGRGLLRRRKKADSSSPLVRLVGMTKSKKSALGGRLTRLGKVSLLDKGKEGILANGVGRAWRCKKNFRAAKCFR